MTRSFPKAARLAVAAALFGVLAGCVSTRGLEPQGRMSDPDHLQVRHSLKGVALTPAAWPKADWWTALGDPQLDALVDEALRNSPTLEQVDARVRVAQAQASAQDAARKPKVGAQAEYSGIRIPATAAPAPIGGKYFGVEILGVNASWAPDLWGGHRAAWEAAVDQAHAVQIDAQAARLTLSSNVVQAYIELRHAVTSEEIATRELGRNGDSLKLEAQRVKAGLDSAFQQRQTEAAVATAQRAVEAAREQQALLRATLAALVGNGPDRGLEIARPVALHAEPFALPADLPSELLARRPDVVAARWRVEAASRGIAATKVQFYPSINLSATVGLASASLGSLFSLPARFVQLGPAVSLPIFDGGRLRAALAEHDADFDVAVAQYDQTLVDALHQVAEPIITLRSIDEQVASQRQAQAAAQSAYDLGMQRYRGGVSNYIDVLTVQQSLLRSEQQLADLDSQRLVASVRLVQALGGGFGPDADLPAAGAADPTAAAPSAR